MQQRAEWGGHPRKQERSNSVEVRDEGSMQGSPWIAHQTSHMVLLCDGARQELGRDEAESVGLDHGVHFGWTRAWLSFYRMPLGAFIIIIIIIIIILLFFISLSLSFF